MKLLDKYNRISLITTVVVIIITGFVYYFTISYILTNRVDKDLTVEEHEIFDYVKLNNRLPQVFKSEGLKIQFEPIGKDTVTRVFVSTQYVNEQEQEGELARALKSWVAVNNTNYSITIIESTVETEDLIRLIFVITLGIILLLIVTLIIINRLVIRNLWKPFYDMLFQIKLFNLKDKSNITGLHTSIEEFRDMNQEISAMSSRVRQDYLELKNFVENAAHELMTPIAVMNSKLDTLIQNSNLNEQQASLIGDMYGTIAKLTRLNKAMLLLTKIENKLITDQESLDLKVLVEETCHEFHDLAAAKNLEVKLNMEDATIVISKTLLDILLGNLLSNAIRHNYNGGEIIISLNNKELIIENTGKAEPLDESTVFQRFHKSPESEGSGLGLTLARQICENYGFQLSYSYQYHLHHFSVRFN